MSKIEFNNVTKDYDRNTVIDNINFNIEEGEFVTIIGSSGSGKTTILKMINGLVEPTSGNILINDENISYIDKIELRRNIGYVVQGNVLFPHMTVQENINFVPDLKKEDPIDVEELLNSVNLDSSFLNRMPNELSGGQQQRVGIIRALSSSPNILLMDEPFGAVDAITREQLQDEIKRIHDNSNLTIIFVTHDIREALFLSDKIIVTNEGVIEQMGTPSDIINNPKTDFVKQLIRRIKEVK